MAPLADRIRPESFEDVVGQQKLIGENGILSKIAQTKNIPNMIFYGPSGVGKTTVARIIAKMANKKIFRLNGTSSSISDVKDIISQIGTLDTLNGILLYLDEIQYFNKKQQQSLLEYIENGDITLIASTTENPYFYIYGAVLSRCNVFEFTPLEVEDIMSAVVRAVKVLEEEDQIKIKISDKCLDFISYSSGGDVRKAVNILETAYLAGNKTKTTVTIDIENIKMLTQKTGMRYDRNSDEHYNILSAYQKSMRGSDQDAALHYLARLLEAGDLISACRRLLVTSSEDIGLAYPNAVTIVKACVDSAMQLGLPEARIPLAQAVVLLCTSPKSNSAYNAINEALSDVRSGIDTTVPTHLKDSHYGGAKKMGHGIDYKYPHSFPSHYVKQQYLPDKLKDKIYYSFGDNKFEKTCQNAQEKIKK